MKVFTFSRVICYNKTNFKQEKLMTIYVDKPKWKLGRMKMCHMVSDESLDELHEMAQKIGRPKKDFQNKNDKPHYDICKSKRKLAIKFGAIEVSSKEIIYALRRLQCKS